MLFIVVGLVAGTLAAVRMPGSSGPGANAGILGPGSQGSSGTAGGSVPFWDPRGWFSSGSGSRAPASTVVPGTRAALAARPNVVRQAVAPPVRRVRELASARSEFSRTYLLSDGRRQAVISAGPVNYKDRSGR